MQNFFKQFLGIYLLIGVVGLYNLVLANNDDDIILPIKLSSQGLPTTSIQIQNHNIPLIFDTGASKSSIVLSKMIVNKLNLKLVETDKQTCFLDDTGKKTCPKTYIIPKLTLGKVILKNVPCELMDQLWGGHYDEGFIWFEAAKNGVIGTELIRQFNVMIDYKNSRVVLSKLGKYPHKHDTKAWTQIPFSLKYGITTSTKINDKIVVLVWDTGANKSTMKSTAKVLAEKNSCESKNDQSCYFETTTFVIDGKQLPKTRFAIQKDELPFDGLIGTDFFQKHTVFFDFKNNQALVETR